MTVSRSSPLKPDQGRSGNGVTDSGACRERCQGAPRGGTVPDFQRSRNPQSCRGDHRQVRAFCEAGVVGSQPLHRGGAVYVAAALNGVVVTRATGRAGRASRQVAVVVCDAVVVHLAGVGEETADVVGPVVIVVEGARIAIDREIELGLFEIRDRGAVIDRILEAVAVGVLAVKHPRDQAVEEWLVALTAGVFVPFAIRNTVPYPLDSHVLIAEIVEGSMTPLTDGPLTIEQTLSPGRLSWTRWLGSGGGLAGPPPSPSGRGHGYAHNIASSNVCSLATSPELHHPTARATTPRTGTLTSRFSPRKLASAHGTLASGAAAR